MAHQRPARSQGVAAGLAWALVALGLAGCHHTRPPTRPVASTTTTVAAGADGRSPDMIAAPVARRRGGSARVAVWEEPDPAAPTLGGAAVRSLVLPQLFLAQPDGSWAAALAQPGSDRTGPDATSATLALRPGAVWSNGAPITADDLRRSADKRFVSDIDGPGPDGTITLRFTQPLPGWRRLWSGVDSVAPPAPGVWGGPFVVASRTPGLEVVLARNEHWYGRAGPFLDEVRLVLVPDAVTARQLLGRGDVDVVMAPAGTVRTAQFKALSGVSVETVPGPTGWWVGLLLAPDHLTEARRKAVVATVDRQAFVSVLLKDEARPLDGFATSVEGGTWRAVTAGDASALSGQSVDLVGENEEPMTSLLQRSMQLRARSVKGDLELRNAEADRVEGWVAAGTYDAAIVQLYDGPQVCWQCRWGSVNAALAAKADAGDGPAQAALEATLRDRALALPLWRPVPVVAFRGDLHGVRVNGYGLSGGWDAWEWFR